MIAGMFAAMIGPDKWFRAVLALLLCCAVTSDARAEIQVSKFAPGLYYGDAPKSAEDFQTLRKLGVRTVLEMRKFRPRKSAQEQAMANRFGLIYRFVPLGFHPTRDGTPELALHVLSNRRLHPIYMHCNLGRDRTGLIIALYRVRYLGWSRRAAFAGMQRQQFNPLLRDLDRYFWKQTR